MTVKTQTPFSRHTACHAKRGQALVEYVYILSFISIIAVAVMINLQLKVQGTKDTVKQQLVASQSYH